MEDFICDRIAKTEIAKAFLEVINKKYKKFSKNEKNELLSTLHSTIYDGISGIREHIDKIMACYHKIKAIGMELDEDYRTIEEMTTILAKEEDDMKKGRARSVVMVMNQNKNGQKRKPLQKNTNDNKPFKK
ncbi:Hypothetical predicted protein [Olea europaea subsp. europaea]|uniref:Uncharacterized protein n=1 Tax=Olea europaea subsp. europaea TaxID=158383 RepID=A0A8S0UY79_OLEEU|nr:Hypothetical predicted protein [Olea europaea subsp. europaea]